MTRSIRDAALAALSILALACDAPVGEPPADGAGGGKADDLGAIDPCQAAVEAVARCAGPQPIDLASVCADQLAAASGDERDALIGDLQAIARAGRDCRVPPSRLGQEIENAESLGHGSFGSKLFAIACTPVVLTASVINRARNSDIEDRDMPASIKGMLRPFFDASVDEAFVYFDAQVINEWNVGDTEIVIGDPISGQTIGHRVYINEPLSGDGNGDGYQHVLVGHEMVHVRQAECFGGTTKFAWHYCEQFYKAGFEYWNNALEVAAYDVQDSLWPCTVGDCDAAPVSCETAGAED